MPGPAGPRAAPDLLAGRAREWGQVFRVGWVQRDVHRSVPT